MGIRNQLDTSTTAVFLFVIKKAKTAKDVFNKKVFTTGIPAAAPALQFLKAKKQK